MFAASMRDLVDSGAHTDPELHGYRSQALPPTYRTNQLAAALFKRRFLAMTNPSKMQERYTKCRQCRPAAPFCHACQHRRPLQHQHLALSDTSFTQKVFN
jgi:hypothetical protein